MSGFLSWLVERCSGITMDMGSNFFLTYLLGRARITYLLTGLLTFDVDSNNFFADRIFFCYYLKFVVFLRSNVFARQV